jgi:aspartate/methionine/tyrosine aminotransferase
MTPIPRTQLDLRRFAARRMQTVPRVGSRVTDAALEQLIVAGADVLCPKPYPTTPLPEHVIEAARKAIQEMVNPPSTGIPEFRQAVANTLSRELSISIDPNTQVLATSGGMHALSIVFSALLDHGDSVLVPSPCYFLDGLITPLGANIIRVPTPERNGFAWDFEFLERSVTKSTKLLFLNTPVNPTGYVLREQDLENVAGIAERHDLLIVADESYDKLVYDGLRHRSVASLERARNRTILVRSFTKSYAMPNWRVGYIVAQPALLIQFTKALEWMMLYGNYVSQKAAAAALSGSQEWLTQSLHEFERNRNLFCDGLEYIPAVSLIKPMGGPFVFPNVSRLKDGSDEVSRVLLREFGIPSVPGSAFGSDHHIRIALGGTQSLIEVLIQRFKQGVERIGLK